MKKRKVNVTRSLLLVDNEIYGAKGRLLARCWREDVAAELLDRLNSQPVLLDMCRENIGYFQQLRRFFEQHQDKDGANMVMHAIDNIIKQNRAAITSKTAPTKKIKI